MEAALSPHPGAEVSLQLHCPPLEGREHRGIPEPELCEGRCACCDVMCDKAASSESDLPLKALKQAVAQHRGVPAGAASGEGLNGLCQDSGREGRWPPSAFHCSRNSL